MPYTIPNVHVDYLLTDTGIPVGFWRSVNNSYNAFAVECFIDELAHAAKRDPYEYRRDLLTKAPRHLGVLNLQRARRAGAPRLLPVERAASPCTSRSRRTSPKSPRSRSRRTARCACIASYAPWTAARS